MRRADVWFRALQFLCRIALKLINFVINMSTTTKLFVDGGIYRFNGLLSDLKHFVDETLGLKGNWSSPGGDVKLFNAADSGFAIKWYGHSKKLVIQTDNEHYLKRKFASLANPVGSDVVAG